MSKLTLDLVYNEPEEEEEEKFDLQKYKDMANEFD